MSKVEVELQPMRIPNFILGVAKPGRKQDGFREGPKWSLSEISEETLSELCNQFRKDVFEKAGKVDPQKGERDEN